MHVFMSTVESASREEARCVKENGCRALKHQSSTENYFKYHTFSNILNLERMYRHNDHSKADDG